MAGLKGKNGWLLWSEKIVVLKGKKKNGWCSERGEESMVAALKEEEKEIENK